MSNAIPSHYLKHGQHTVKGWLVPGAAQAIVLLSSKQREQLCTGGIAEIGVHHGKLFILLYLLCSGNEAAVAVDLFSHQDLNIDGSGAGDLARFKQNLRRHADLSRLVVHEGDSTQLTSEQLMELGRGPLRLISLDGGHPAALTARDLAICEGALADGGIIVLDDCFNGAWPGVSDGVHQFFSAPRTIVPFALGANKTFFCRYPFVSRYADALKELDASAAEQEFLGHSVVCFAHRPSTIAGWFGKVDAFRLFRRTYHYALSRL